VSPAVEAEARNLLEQVLPKLSYASREVLVLRYVEELSIAEIASMLNLGESAAKMRLSRAREEFWGIEQNGA
jgi:RNA polymerase sigma-70 factor (ECF subfamily)